MNEWKDKAACKGLTDLMYPARGDHDGLMRALAICDSCTVRAECFEYVLDLGEPEGIWAGTTARQRRAMRAESFRRQARCGTTAKYRAGCRCDECRAAVRAYDRERKRRRPSAA